MLLGKKSIKITIEVIRLVRNNTNNIVRAYIHEFSIMKAFNVSIHPTKLRTCI